MKTDDSNNTSPDSGPIDANPSSNKEWIELRHQLIGPEIKKVERIEERLNDPSVRATEISRILPEAITLGVTQSSRISRALQPAIDQSLKVSVAKNPQALAEAIFPALGPGIRKAIRATIAGMIQSLNTILNQSFSVRGLKWRLEAFKTRTSFAEIVLFHTLVFQVEQIFLIHRSTGVVLQHVEADGASAKDPDLVSGMLTAIQDFMNDSFHPENNDEIETLRMGKDRSIWVEQGPNVIIAAVILGRPPLELRQQYRQMVDVIHLRYLKYINEFNGDVTPFAITREILEGGLKQKAREGVDKKISPLLIILLTGALLTIGAWIFSAYRMHLKFENYCQKLKAEPGIVLIQTDRQKGRYVISSLKDPLARDVTSIAKAAGLNSSDIIHKWVPYYSLHPTLIASRAQKWLTPPETVTFIIKEGTIKASGSAHNQWINHFCKRAILVPGIEKYDTTNLDNLDLKKMDKTIQDLSSINIIFDRGKSTIAEKNIELIKTAANKIQDLQTMAKSLAIPLQVTIYGYTDASGNETMNKHISQKRAQKVLQYLLKYNLNPMNLYAVGKGTHSKATSTNSLTESAIYRTVTFNAIR